MNTKMKNIKKIAILFILTSGLVFGQKLDSISFDTPKLLQKSELASWLMLYDKIAWYTSDSVMTQSNEELERLGRQWFCFESEDKCWHAVYGKYENNNYDLVFHYTIDSNFKIERINESIDTFMTNSYSRALDIAYLKSKETIDSTNIRLNQFIKRNTDSTLTVWLFPSIYNNHAVYGGEFIYTFNKTGVEILEDNSYYQGEFRGFKIDGNSEVWLNFTELDEPTLGAVFFTVYFRNYFKQIFIDNKDYFSSIFENGHGQQMWITKHKEQKE